MIAKCVFSHLGVFFNFGKPLTTENTVNKTTPKICNFTATATIVSCQSCVAYTTLVGNSREVPPDVIFGLYD